MANELYNIYLLMGEKKSGLVGSGNGIRKNPLFVKALEERFGAKMKTPLHEEEAAFGSALFALIAVGEYKDEKQARQNIKYNN
jgi:sedoheptulokinase